MFEKIKSNAAFSLLEIVIAVAIFTSFAAALLLASVHTDFDMQNSADSLQVRYYTQEAQEALRSIRDTDWENLTIGGPYGLDSSSGHWELTGASDTYNEFTRTVTLTEAGSNSIEAVITIEWTNALGVELSRSASMQFTNWQTSAFIVDTQSEFDEGHFNSTESISEGSVQLQSVIAWTGASHLWDLNLDGSGDPIEIIAVENTLYVLTEATSGQEFTSFDISDVSSSGIQELDSVELGGEDAFDMSIDDGYAYISLEDEDSEILVVDLSSMSIVETYDLDTDKKAHGIDALDGELVVVTEEYGDDAELFILDASDPENLSLDSSVEVDDDLYDVEIYGDYAFAVGKDSSEELKVFKLSTATQVNQFNLDGSEDATEIHISDDGTTAYRSRESNSNEEFHVLDISTPETSFGSGNLLGEVEISEDVKDIHVVGDLAFLATKDGSQEVTLVDLTGYSINATIDAQDSSDSHTVWMQGAYLYIGVEDNSQTIQVYETGSAAWEDPLLLAISDPADNRNFYDIFYADDHVFVGRDSEGTCDDSDGDDCEFLIYDVSDPSTPELSAALEIGQDVNDIWVSNDIAYLATSHNSKELILIDVSDPENPSELGSYNSDESKNGMSVWSDGSTAYLGTANNSGSNDREFYVIDVTTSSSPTLLGSYEVGNDANDIVVYGNNAFIASTHSSKEVHVVDVSSPSAPIAVTQINHSGSGDAEGLFLNEEDETLHMVFASNGSSGEYSIYDVSDAQNPSHLDTLNLSGRYNMVAVMHAQNLAFLAGDPNNSELVIVDITDTADISQFSSFDLDADGRGIVTDGSYLYVASEHNDEELQVIGHAAMSTSYSQWGSYRSKAFDSGSSSTNWLTIESESTGETLSVQTRTASSESGLDSATWMSLPGDNIQIAPDSTGEQFLQVEVIFSGDGSDTPVLESLTIEYN